MSYDNWKTATPPEYSDEPYGCEVCKEDACSCMEIDEHAIGPCIGAECVNPHDRLADECATAEQTEAYEAEAGAPP